YFITVLFLFSFSFVTYGFADLTVEGITVNLDKATWNFPNSITLSNIFIQNNGMTLKLDDASEQREYNFFRSGSLTPYEISLVDFTSEKIDFSVDSPVTDAVLTVSGTKIDGVTLNGAVSSFTYDGVVNTININSATLVSIYFINAPQAPQTGGGSSGDRTAPTFNTFSVTGAKTLQEDGTIGFGGILNQEIQLTNKMPTAIVETGNEIQLRVLLYENSGTSALQHIGLYTNLHDNKGQIDKSDTYVEYDKGKPIKIVNKNGYLSDADVSFVQRNNNLEAVFSLTFAKQMDVSNIVVRAWDMDRNSRDAIFLDAIKVEQAQLSPSEKLESQSEVKQESDLVKMDPEPLLSIPMLKQWAGFSEDSVSDEEFLKNLGLEGTKMPSWFKKSQVAKWVIEETISQRELLDTLKFFEKNGILN
ncbi:MAG: hypothetical protein WD966_00145, partial [Nitrosopumilaceae archaeon]